MKSHLKTFEKSRKSAYALNDLEFIHEKSLFRRPIAVVPLEL